MIDLISLQFSASCPGASKRPRLPDLSAPKRVATIYASSHFAGPDTGQSTLFPIAGFICHDIPLCGLRRENLKLPPRDELHNIAARQKIAGLRPVYVWSSTISPSCGT